MKIWVTKIQWSSIKKKKTKCDKEDVRVCLEKNINIEVVLAPTVSICSQEGKIYQPGEAKPQNIYVLCIFGAKVLILTPDYMLVCNWIKLIGLYIDLQLKPQNN